MSKLLGNDSQGRVPIPSPCRCCWCDDFICSDRTPWSRISLYFRSGEFWIKGFFCSRQCLRNAEADDYLGESYSRRHYEDAPSCFITTAICKENNKPDDCIELETLRTFRDSFMMSDEIRKLDVYSYYNLAPKIVLLLNSEVDSLYPMLNHRWLQPAVSCVQNGDNKEAYELYTEMMHFLLSKYEDSLVSNEE
jgi:hypothetical protein